MMGDTKNPILGRGGTSAIVFVHKETALVNNILNARLFGTRKIPALEWLATQFECLLRIVFCWPSSSSLGCCCSDASGREGRHSVDQDTHPSNERPNNHHFRRLAAKTASDTRTTQLSSTCASQPESIRLIGPLRLKSSRSSVSAKSASQSASGPASAGAAKSEENGRLHSSKRMEETICEELNVSSTRSEWV